METQIYDLASTSEEQLNDWFRQEEVEVEDEDLLLSEAEMVESWNADDNTDDLVFLEDGTSRCLGLDALPLGVEDPAMAAAMSSRSLIPILKEELRCKIQLKRLEMGQDEITVNFETKSSPMSVDEIVKKNKKLEQNRLSAQRSRERQKSLEKTIQNKMSILKKHNEWLTKQTHLLRYACRLAHQWLEQHQTCPCLTQYSRQQFLQAGFLSCATPTSSTAVSKVAPPLPPKMLLPPLKSVGMTNVSQPRKSALNKVRLGQSIQQ